MFKYTFNLHCDYEEEKKLIKKTCELFVCKLIFWKKLCLSYINCCILFIAYSKWKYSVLNPVYRSLSRDLSFILPYLFWQKLVFTLQNWISLLSELNPSKLGRSTVHFIVHLPLVSKEQHGKCIIKCIFTDGN